MKNLLKIFTISFFVAMPLWASATTGGPRDTSDHVWNPESETYYFLEHRYDESGCEPVPKIFNPRDGKVLLHPQFGDCRDIEEAGITQEAISEFLNNPEFLSLKAIDIKEAGFDISAKPYGSVNDSSNIFFEITVKHDGKIVLKAPLRTTRVDQEIEFDLLTNKELANDRALLVVTHIKDEGEGGYSGQDLFEIMVPKVQPTVIPVESSGFAIDRYFILGAVLVIIIGMGVKKFVGNKGMKYG